MSVTVNVVGQTAVSVSVAASTSVSVVASGGIGPAGFITVPGTATLAFGTFQFVPGDGITVSTANGQFLISSYPSTSVSSLAPVQSVAGRTGTIVLQAADVTAGTFAIGRIPTIGYTALSGVPVEFTPASHTHDAAAISSGTLSIARVPTISYTALSNTPATFAPQAHTHSTSDVVAFTAAASAAAPVQNVAGRTGAISLVAADVAGLAAVATSGSYTSLQNVPGTFAPQAHTHSTADITGFTGTFAAGNHTHDAAAITSGVLDLARIPTIGYTALSGVPASFNPQAHTHSTTDVVGLTASFSQVAHAHQYVQVLNGLTGTVSIAGGAGVTVSTASSSITIAAAGSYVLPEATESVLGGIKVGSGLAIASGVLSTTGGGGSGNIVEAATPAGFPATGASNVIYVATDTARAYIWAGAYFEVGAGGGGGSGISWSSVPASASATGTAGQIAYDSDYFYVATAANTWERAALSTWAPVASIAGLQLWLDASDASTLFDATTGGYAVAADGAVARWEDKSGNARHATQDTSQSRPIRKLSVQNGLGGLRFDGSNDFLTTATGYHTSDVTIFVVAKRSSGETDALFQSGNSTGLGYTVADSFVSSFDNCYARGVANGQVGSVLPGTSWRAISVTYTAGTRKVYIQGVLSDTESFTITAPNVANGIATWIGTADFAGSNLNGDIGEMIAYNAVLSDTDRAAVEQYLISKWAIT
jgi:hypothetical protein